MDCHGVPSAGAYMFGEKKYSSPLLIQNEHARGVMLHQLDYRCVKRSQSDCTTHVACSLHVHVVQTKIRDPFFLLLLSSLL